MKKLIILLTFLASSTISNAQQSDSSIDKNLRSEFQLPLGLYLNQLSRNVGYFFELDSRYCDDNKKLNRLSKDMISIGTSPNSSIYEHLSQIAEDIGNDYNITIDLPLKTISLSCANNIKSKADAK